MANDDSQRLAHQFAKSLQRWGGWSAHASCDSTHLISPANEEIARTFSIDHPLRTGRYESRKNEWAQIVHISRVFLNACLVQQLDYLTGPCGLQSILDSLDSPIEALMLLSLILCAREHGLGVLVVHTHPVLDRECQRENELDFALRSNRLKLEIRPQAHVGDHRVDFLLSHYGTDIIRSKGSVVAGREEWSEIRVDKKMIVECDGHDFHEKTKEQARRDKERDRNLQSLGFPVYRYTGSELYKDVFLSASEIVRVLTGRDFREYEPDCKNPA